MPSLYCGVMSSFVEIVNMDRSFSILNEFLMGRAFGVEAAARNSIPHTCHRRVHRCVMSLSWKFVNVNRSSAFSICF